MNWIDFFIGFALMNAMPHFVLGIWKGRMFSGFGFGNTPNVVYSLLNFGISIGLFGYAYGVEGILENGIFAGAVAILLIYYITGQFWYQRFRKKEEMMS